MKNQKISYSLEAFYELDNLIDSELDASIKKEIPEIMKKEYKTTCKWSYQESTFGGKYCNYRLIGFNLGRKTSEIEQLDIINAIKYLSDAVVMVRFHEYTND